MSLNQSFISDFSESDCFARTAQVICMGVYYFQVVRDADSVSAQYLDNELMECIRMENGI